MRELKIVCNTILFALLVGAVIYVSILLEYPQSYAVPSRPVVTPTNAIKVEVVQPDEVRIAEAYPRYLEKVAGGKHPERLALWPDRLQVKVDRLQEQLTAQVALTDALLLATREALR